MAVKCNLFKEILAFKNQVLGPTFFYLEQSTLRSAEKCFVQFSTKFLVTWIQNPQHVQCLGSKQLYPFIYHT